MQIKEFIWDLSDYIGWAEREDEYADVRVFVDNMLYTINRIRTEATMAAYIEWQSNRIARWISGTKDTIYKEDNLYIMSYIVSIIENKLNHIRYED